MELVPHTPAGIDPRKFEPGALLLTEATAAMPQRLVEVIEWRPANFMLDTIEDTPVGMVQRCLTTQQVRQAKLLRPAPNLIDDMLGAEPVEDPPHIAELFAKCDELLATRRSERYQRRQPRRAA